MVGAFLALFGQIYQTGADASESALLGNRIFMHMLSRVRRYQLFMRRT
jgi:uncharacterized membrane protein